MRTPAAFGLALLLFATSATSDAPKQNHHVTELLASIKGKENRPAGEVFQNVKLLKNVPAARFLRLMDTSYNQALGVDCEHCHVEEMWEVDDKRPKRAAREMIAMMSAINDELGGMQEIDNSDPSVDCVTCHRGYVKPAIQMR